MPEHLQERLIASMPDLLRRQLVHPARRTSLHLCAGTSDDGQQWEVGAETSRRDRLYGDGGRSCLCNTADFQVTCTLCGFALQQQYCAQSIAARKSGRDCGRNQSPMQPSIPRIPMCVRPLFGNNARKSAEAQLRDAFFVWDDITGTLFRRSTAWKNIDKCSASGHGLPRSCTAPLPCAAFEDALPTHISKHDLGPSCRGTARWYMNPI